MLKTIFFVSFVLLFNSLAEANQFGFDFKKNKFSSKFNLIILNKDPKRTIEFHGCYEQPSLETNYYALMKNGSKYNFDSNVFCQIGMKGRYWVNSGETGKIPFRIKKGIMQDAERIVFKGITYIPVTTGYVVDYTDVRELIVVYNVTMGSISFKVGKEVLKQPAFEGNIANNVFDTDSATPAIGNLDGIFNEGIEIDPYRLKSK